MKLMAIDSAALMSHSDWTTLYCRVVFPIHILFRWNTGSKPSFVGMGSFRGYRACLCAPIPDAVWLRRAGLLLALLLPRPSVFSSCFQGQTYPWGESKKKCGCAGKKTKQNNNDNNNNKSASIVNASILDASNTQTQQSQLAVRVTVWMKWSYWPNWWVFGGVGPQKKKLTTTTWQTEEEENWFATQEECSGAEMQTVHPAQALMWIIMCCIWISFRCVSWQRIIQLLSRWEWEGPRTLSREAGG